MIREQAARVPCEWAHDRRAEEDGRAAAGDRGDADPCRQLRRVPIQARGEGGEIETADREVAGVDAHHRRVTDPLLIGVGVWEADQVAEMVAPVARIANAGTRSLRQRRVRLQEGASVVPRRQHPPLSTRVRRGDRRLRLAAAKILLRTRRIHVRPERRRCRPQERIFDRPLWAEQPTVRSRRERLVEPHMRQHHLTDRRRACRIQPPSPTARWRTPRGLPVPGDASSTITP